MLRVLDLRDIVSRMENETRFVLECEEQYHDKISMAAATVLRDFGKRPFVALTGPSGSGKTTTAKRLKMYLENLGVKVIQLGMDNFFFSDDEAPAEADNDWESPYYVNRERLWDAIDTLSRGETAQIPVFDYAAGHVSHTVPVEGSREAIIIVEGIHMLNPLLLEPIHDRSTGVYVAPATRIITPQDQLVTPQMLRVARRLLRDYRTRGHSLRDTVERAEGVDRGEETHIAPYQKYADVTIDSFHDYELCALTGKLRKLPEYDAELTVDFMVSHGLAPLAEAMSLLPAFHCPYVPLNSLIREFIGGSLFGD